MQFYKCFILTLIIAGFQLLMAKEDSTKLSSRLIIPVAYYTPETKISAGLGWMQVFRMQADSNVKPTDTYSSFIRGKALLSQTGQYNIEGSLTLYTPGNKYFIEEVFEYSFVPLPFYGVGNEINPEISEDYSANIFTQNSKLIRKFNSTWFLGLQQQYKRFSLKEVEPNGILENGTVGSEGGITSGLGAVFRRDSRDNVNSSYQGSLVNLEWISYQSIFGSDFNFNHFLLDYRQFIELKKEKLIFAYQARASFNFGAVPFYKLSMLGGDQFMRGYFWGQYRDKHFNMIQAEIRQFYNPYISAAAFVGIGNVFNSIDNIEANSMKYSIGGGFRFTPPDTDRLSIRLDFAYGNDFYWYFTIAEAF